MILLRPGRTAVAIRSLLLAVALLSGCANSDYFEATPIATPGNGMVYIYRPAATNPGKKPLTMSYPEVLIDGESAGFLKYKEYLAIELPPGEHEFRVTGLTREARWAPKDRSYTLTVEPDTEYFMRFRVEFDTARMSIDSFRGQYLIGFHPVDPTEAIYEIRHTDKSR